jgi:manganese efflux pump family protein
VIDALVLALALAMDATAVAAARGVAGATRREVAVLAIAFGAFQAGMAALGLVLGRTAADAIAAWDHWLAFGLLVALGGKMLLDALRGDPAGATAPAAREALRARTIVLLSIATSIDALAAGVTLPVLGAPPAVALSLIGLASLVLSAAGGLAGARIGRRGGRALEIAGGIALIAIGAKTLIEHLR